MVLNAASATDGFLVAYKMVKRNYLIYRLDSRLKFFSFLIDR